MLLVTMTMAAAMLCAEAKPEGVTVSTWVREEIFSGWMTSDMARFEAGVAKLDAILAADPKAADAVAWRAGATMFRGVRALEAGDRAEFDRKYAETLAELKRARAMATPAQMTAVLAVTGGTLATFGDRMPAELRRAAWAQVREAYGELRGVQKAFFDRMPVHMRGEVLAGLAQAEQRLGESGPALAELIAALPDTVYGKRAKLWQEKPEVAAKTALACQTCHEAGRLEPALARMKKQ